MVDWNASLDLAGSLQTSEIHLALVVRARNILQYLLSESHASGLSQLLAVALTCSANAVVALPRPEFEVPHCLEHRSESPIKRSKGANLFVSRAGMGHVVPIQFDGPSRWQVASEPDLCPRSFHNQIRKRMGLGEVNRSAAHHALLV